MSRDFRRSQWAVMPSARCGETSAPYATKVSSSSSKDNAVCSTPAHARKHAWVFGVAATCLLILSGCTFADSNTNNGKAAPPGAVAAAQQPTGPTPMDTFRALAPPEGMKFTPLFSVPVKDDDQRFARLEQSVQALRNDFDTVTPTLVRLAAIEKDIRDLVTQLRTLDDGGPIVEAVPAAPVVVAPVPPPSNVTAQIKPQAVPVAPAAAVPPTPATNKLPGKDVTGGTEAAPAVKVAAGQPAPSLPVTPEAAPTGQLPPEGAASPSLPPRVVVQAPKPAPAPVPAPPAVVPKAAAPAPTPIAPQPKTTTPPLDLTPVMMPDDATVATAAAAAKSADQPAPKVVMGEILGDVRAIRIGDHIDKTRLVLDVTAKAPFKARLENDGRRLVIELPQYAWKADAAWTATSAALVAGYRYADGALVVDLLAPAVIRKQESLPASGGVGPRVMVDLFSSLVHVE